MNPTSTESRRPFGIDTAQWPAQWQAAGALLLGLPGLRRLAPRLPVTLHPADGRGATHWLMAQGVAQPAPDAAPGAPIQALQLPAERVLERRLTLPPLAAADLAQAVALDVAAASPFGPEQTVWGYRSERLDGERLRVDVAIAARAQVEQCLQAAALADDPPPEVWVIPAAAPDGAMRPIVLQGFGEGLRQARTRQGVSRRLGLAALALLVLAALVVTPTALQRAKARQAMAAFDAMQKQAAPQLAQRESLMKQLERLQTLAQLQEQQLALGPVLDLLTRTLPDGAWLTGLRVEGNKLVLNGLADDAAALVQRLAEQPGAHDVRLTSPATRGAGAAKETFIIELGLDAHRYGPVLAGKEAAS